MLVEHGRDGAGSLGQLVEVGPSRTVDHHPDDPWAQLHLHQLQPGSRDARLHQASDVLFGHGGHLLVLGIFDLSPS